MIHPQQDQLMQAAQLAGIRAEDLSAIWSQDAVKYSLGEKNEVIFEGNALGSTPLLATTICSDVPVCRHYLSMLGIPGPKGKIFKLEQEHTSLVQLTELLGAFWVDGTTYLCRPAFDQSGYAVASNIKDMKALEIHLDTFADEYATWIIEEQVEGMDLQILVVDGRLLSAVMRSPLRLVGDGKRTLEEMIDAHNANASGDQIVEIDAETRQLLRDQAVYLSEIVPEGLSVQLKNAAAGAGDANDVTGSLHPRFAEWCASIAQHIGLKLFSMNCKSKTASDDPSHSTWVTQLDAKPAWITFATTAVGADEIAKAILKAVFGS